MNPGPPVAQHDPLGWNAAIAFAFLMLVLANLSIPTRVYFDEAHYVPAARAMMEFEYITNREHPMMGKQLIALGIALFGDNSTGWRIFPALAGGMALFAFMRALWFASFSRFASLAGGVLLATGFLLFIHARIAILDVFMACFVLIGLWMLAAAIRDPATARWRLAAAGFALGLALGSKWTAATVVALPGLVFLAMRLWQSGPRFLTASNAGPVPGISLIEAGIWLGLLPLIVYLATFWPVFFYRQDPLTISGYLEYHRQMWELQQQTIQSHPYMSNWPQWVLNLRPVWYLYEEVDGAQRGVLMIGNPLTMLAGLPALAWCAFTGLFRGNRAGLACVLLYTVSIGMWIIAPKPVQYYYHYLLPSIFLLAALSLALDALWQSGRGKLALAALGASAIVFVLFYPIISASPLSGTYAFEKWMLLDSWR